MIINSLISGALFRRWWGGWFHPKHWVKLPLGFVLPFYYSFYASGDWHVAGIISFFSGLAFLNTFHGEGMNMGRNYPTGPSTKDCILIMGGSYSIYFLLMGLCLFIDTSAWQSIFVMFSGFLIAFGYLFSYWLWETLNLSKMIEYPKGNVFIDGPTSIGEFFLGAIVFSTAYLGGYSVG